MRTVYGRAATAAAATASAGAAYLGARVLEEQVPFERIDHRLGIDRAFEERAFWSSTHAEGAQMPCDIPTMRAANVVTACARLAAALVVDAMPSFRLLSAPSGLPNAGDGAHVTGFAARGSVVAFYHGPVYTPIIGRMKLLFGSSEYVLAMHDSYMIDGLTSGTGSSLGPLTNHPPLDTTPNVMFYPVCCDTASLPVESASALREICWYERPPLTFDGQRYVRTTLLIALRDIEDEEILVDYVRTPKQTPRSTASGAHPSSRALATDPQTLNPWCLQRYEPGAHTPEWYSPVSREETRPRWEPPRPTFDHF